MNGKIKTKFAALFAVALMITVCVVPVVGNEDVQAITVPVDTEALTIAGTVYDADGEELGGAEVIITVTIGKDESTYTDITDSSGTDIGTYSCEILVPEKTIIDEIEVKINTSAKITVNDIEINNPAAGLWSSEPSLTVSGVDVAKTDLIEGLDFKAGYYRISGALKYKSGQPYMKEVEVYLYEVNEVANSSPKTYTYKILDEYKATSVDGLYAIYVPSDITPEKEGGTFAVGAEIPNISYSSVAGVTINKSATMNISSGDTYLFKIKSNALIDEEIELSVPSTSPVILDEEDFEIVANTQDKEYEPILVEYTLDATKSGKEEVIVEGKYGAVEELEIDGDDYFVTYNQTAYVSGTVVMGDVPALEGKVTLTLLEGNDEKNYNANVVDGNFIIWYDNDLDESKVDDEATVVYEYKNFKEEVEIDDFEYLEAKTDVEVEVDDGGYELITGKVNGLAAGSSISINVDGTDIFGLDKDGIIETKYDADDEEDVFAFMVPVGTIVTITPDDEYTYDVESIELQVLDEIEVSFTMDSKDVEIEFVDYDDEPLNGVTVYPATYNKGQEKWIPGTVIGGTTNPIVSVNGKWVWKVAGNLDLSETYVVFDSSTRTFENDKDSTPLTPVSIESIDERVKVLDVRRNVQILNADSVMIENLDIDVMTYSVYVKNGVEVFDVKATPVYDLQWDALNKTYYFVGLVGDQEISSTANDVLAIVIPNTVTGIFDPIYPIDEDGVTVIQSYRNTVTGTIYEADEKTVITTMGGTNVSFYSDASATAITKQIKKDGTFVINTYGDIDKDSYITIGSNKYTFIGEDNYKHKVIGEDGKPVTKFYADQMSFEVSFADADGKAIKYTTATVNGASVDDGKVIIAPTEGAPISISGMPVNRSFNNYGKITDSMISSKKIDFVSDQATYTVKLTDSADKMWDLESEMQIWSVTDTVNVLKKEFTVPANKGKASVLMDVPQDGKTYVVKAESATYFGTQEYAFTNYAVTVPAIGSFVKVTAAEANGTLFASDVISGADVYVKGESVPEVYSADNNVVEYFAVDGKEYEFVVNESSTDYSFGNTNGGKISAVDGLLLANEETVKGQVTFANGYNFVSVSVYSVQANYTEGTPVSGTLSSENNGTFDIIVDKDKVVSYQALKSSAVAGESATPEIVLKESYFTGAAPKDAVMKVSLYKGDDFVKSTSVTPSNGEYGFAMDVSDGDRIVMTITANEKTFQQAIDLKAVQNDIIVPGTLVTDMTDALFSKYYVISGADTAVIGSKIVLSAQKTISAPMDVANVAYTTLVFDGWYVNGEKVSDDVNATYTVNGPCEVYAYYTEKVTETGAVADSSNDLSMDVLILGIVIVVLALLAFVYAVKFKKE